MNSILPQVSNVAKSQYYNAADFAIALDMLIGNSQKITMTNYNQQIESLKIFLKRLVMLLDGLDIPDSDKINILMTEVEDMVNQINSHNIYRLKSLIGLKVFEARRVLYGLS